MYFSRRVASLRLVLLATLYIYVVNHIPYMYCINYFNKSCLAVNFSELSVSKIMVAKPDLTGGGRGGGNATIITFKVFFPYKSKI